MDTVFYDGHCGLCHRTVRWILAADGDGSKFRFAPLDSEAFRKAVPQAGSLPDSFVVRTEDGRILTRSTAFIEVTLHLGGAWRLLGWFLRLVPAAVRDRVYDAVARARHKWFAPPQDACPVIPPQLRSRFDL